MCIYVTYHHEPHCEHVTTSDPDRCRHATARNKLCPRDAPTSHHHIFTQDHACPDCLRLKRFKMQREAECTTPDSKEQRTADKTNASAMRRIAHGFTKKYMDPDGDLDEATLLFGSSPLENEEEMPLFDDVDDAQEDETEEGGTKEDAEQADDDKNSKAAVEGAKAPVLDVTTMVDGSDMAPDKSGAASKSEGDDEAVSLMSTSRAIDIPFRKNTAHRHV